MNNNAESIVNELTVYNPINDVRRIRVGNKFDGGYVMLDQGIKELQAFYSYGVNDDYSFDDNLSKISNSIGRLFDPTVAYPKKITDRLYFKKIGLATGEGTVRDHVSMYGDMGKKMILKLDIEGAEWTWLKHTTQEELSMFDQILIEYHDFKNSVIYESCQKCLKKINELFYLYHVHGNNHRPLVNINKTYIPDVLECSYIRKDLCECKVNEKILFPVKNIDLPNHHWLPDIKLNYWPFISNQSEKVESSAHEEAKAFNKMHSVYKLMYQEILRLNMR
jgi:hypothetical protein